MNQSRANNLHSKLFICLLLASNSFNYSFIEKLNYDRYTIALISTIEEFFEFVHREKQQLDCLILQHTSELPQVIRWLQGQAIVLPTVILNFQSDTSDEGTDSAKGYGQEQAASPPPHPDRYLYHTAEVYLAQAQLNQIEQAIEQAIVQFIKLSPTCRLSDIELSSEIVQDVVLQKLMMLQQHQLTDKLKERLGYLGVYYKRNPQNFLRHLPPEKKQELLGSLKSSYHEIVLRYFANDGTLNQRIDDFVNIAFFTDISVSQVVEIHMDLMDDFSKQLKLEGRSEDVLLDYRLTLIDTLAHLCEMYRRSIPRES